MEMEDENPRIMYGVIITVYVDRQTSNGRSFQARRRKNEGDRFIDRTLKREIGRPRGYDRRANLLAYIRQMRAESLARNSKCESLESDNNNNNNNKLERPIPKKKKRRWIGKMMNKFRLPFRRKNRMWRYRQFVPDGEEGEAKRNSYDLDLWKKLKHVVGRLSRGCVRK